MSISTSLSDTISEQPPYMGREWDGQQAQLPARIALIIGIDAYNFTSKISLKDLKYAVKDAQDMRAALKSAGFTHLQLLTNSTAGGYVTRNDILNALSELDSKAARITAITGRKPIVMVYFAGHGVSQNGKDYLLPSDFRPIQAEDVPEMAISVDTLVKRLSWADASLRIVVMDACRSVFPQIIPKRTYNGEKSILDPGHKGTLDPETYNIARDADRVTLFSTFEGGASYEDGEANGRFTGAFVQAITSAQSKAMSGTSADSELDRVFDDIVNAMKTETQSKQQPKMLKEASRFRLYPTITDFTREQEAWTKVLQNSGFAGYSGQAAIIGSIDPLNPHFKIRYCNARSFLNEFSRYSYFSQIALDDMNAFASKKFKCEGPMLKVTSVNDAHGYVLSGENVTINDLPSVIPVMSGSAFPALVDINGVPAKEKNSSISYVGLDTIGIVNRPLALRADPEENSREVAQIESYQSVAVLGPSKSGSVKVQTVGGEVGFISSKNISSGRIAVKFDLNTQEVPGTAMLIDRLRTLSKEVVFTNALIEYPRGLAQDGYMASQRISDSINDIFKAQITPRFSWRNLLGTEVGKPDDRTAYRDGEDLSASQDRIPIAIRSFIEASDEKITITDKNNINVTIIMFVADATLRSKIDFIEGEEYDSDKAMPLEALERAVKSSRN